MKKKIIKTKTQALADARDYKRNHASKDKSQNEMVLEYMKLYKSITPREADVAFACMRLGSRINELRKDYDILTITNGESAPYATYILEGGM